MEVHTEGTKSSANAMIMELADAEALGFVGYLYPAPALEISAVHKHGIFGRQGNPSNSKLKKKGANIATSRLVIVIRVDRFTRMTQKAQARWVTQGFRNDQHKRPDRSELLPKKSHAVAGATVALIIQLSPSAATLADIKEAFLRGGAWSSCATCRKT